jgi:hypothetical protein
MSVIFYVSYADKLRALKEVSMQGSERILAVLGCMLVAHMIGYIATFMFVEVLPSGVALVAILLIAGGVGALYGRLVRKECLQERADARPASPFGLWLARIGCAIATLSGYWYDWGWQLLSVSQEQGKNHGLGLFVLAVTLALLAERIDQLTQGRTTR